MADPSTPEDGSTFHLKPEAFAELRNLVVGGMALGCLTFCLLVWLAVREEGLFWQMLLCGALSALFALITFWGVLRIRKQWSSYRITLDGELITRQVEEFDTVDLHRGEITGLVPLTNRGVRVLSEDPAKSLVIPEALDGYDQVLAWLPEVERHPPRSLFAQRGTALAGLAAALVLTLLFMTHGLLWVRLLSGFLLVDGMLVLLYWVNRRSGLNVLVRGGLSFSLLLWVVLLLAKMGFMVFLP